MGCRNKAAGTPHLIFHEMCTKSRVTCIDQWTQQYMSPRNQNFREPDEIWKSGATLYLISKSKFWAREFAWRNFGFVGSNPSPTTPAQHTTSPPSASDSRSPSFRRSPPVQSGHLRRLPAPRTTAPAPHPPPLPIPRRRTV